jgi:hypothetical protein
MSPSEADPHHPIFPRFSLKSLIAVGCVLVSFSVVGFADPLVIPPPGVPPSEVLDRYLTSTQEQRFRDLSMEVEIEAKLPRLKKQGTFHALRRVTELGQITYNGVRFVGDKMIKKDVIARYLTAETKAANGNSNGKGKKQSLTITPQNYKFKYKGMADLEGDWVYIFEVSPRKKRVGLFKGEVWVDAATFLPVRETGRFVKTPSIFLKKVEFVRDYDIRDGMALPRRITSQVYTRIVGKAELSIEFSNVSVEGKKVQAMVCPIGW